MERNKIAVGDVGLWLFHQANLNLLQGVGKSLGIPMERIFINVDKYGNTSSRIAVDCCVQKRTLKV